MVKMVLAFAQLRLAILYALSWLYGWLCCLSESMFTMLLALREFCVAVAAIIVHVLQGILEGIGPEPFEHDPEYDDWC